MEAVKTNVIGTENVLTAAIEEGVEAVICLSTDKAASPINAIGITKSVEEKAFSDLLIDNKLQDIMKIINRVAVGKVAKK